MQGILRFLTLGVVLLALSGCSLQTVPERLPLYVGAENKALINSIPEEGISGQEKIGLVVINDTTAPSAAPAFTPESLERLTHRLRAELNEQLPITIEKVIRSSELRPGQSSRQFVQLAEAENVDFFLLGLVSSVENEVPTQLSFQGGQAGLGGGLGRLLGFRVENYALVELALINGKTGNPVVHANGSAWSVLERLNVPIESNVYPVVRRDLTQPPIYPSDETAYETLRVVSADDAMKQALMHLRKAWRQPSSS
ncbi:MAG: hypothetical protein MRJ96_02440 [Nitrospirales bacterium]|nr:hypothetical protein [Nitrospira sp.]MDR4500300.1 hypothetical protein [Nitrospirales bacterium]